MIKIIRQPKGKVKLVGYNSDIIGFSQSIQPLLQPHHKKALILGTGGASKAVYHGLKNLGIESVFVSRTHKADNMLTYEELTPEIMAEHTIIINTTPVTGSMFSAILPDHGGYAGIAFLIHNPFPLTFQVAP